MIHKKELKMMKKSLFICLLYIFSNISLPQSAKLIGPPGGLCTNIAPHSGFPNIIYSYQSNTSGAFKSIDGGIIVQPVHLKNSVSGKWKFYPSPTDTSKVFALNISDLYRFLLISQNGGMEFNIVELMGDTARVLDLSFNPYDGGIIYIITDKSEIWKSYDSGEIWYKVHTFDMTSRYTNISVAKGDTSFVYVSIANSIYRSTNSGNEWNLRGFFPDLAPFRLLKINPLNENSIYLVDNQRFELLKSIDGGETIEVLSSELSFGDFIINPLDTSILYSITIGHSLNEPEDPGIFKSLDGGLNWNSIINGLPPKYRWGYSLALNPQNPDEIYSGIYHYGVYKSINGGCQWFRTNLSYSAIIWLDFPTGLQGNVIATNYPWVVQMTTDFGDNWFIPNFQPPFSDSVGISYYDFNPFNRNEGYFTDYNKVYKTFDGGFNWNEVTPFPNVHAVWYHHYNSSILFATDKSFDMWISSDAGNSWTFNSNEYGGGFTVFDVTDERIFYAYWAGQLQKTTDMGNSWINIHNGLVPIEPGSNNPAHITGFGINPENSLILYCTQDKGLSKSTNGGENWFQIDSTFKDFNIYANFSGLYVDPEIPGRFYVGTYEGYPFTPDYTTGGLFRTEDEGKTWIKLYSGNVNYIKGDYSNPQKIYYGTKFGIMVISDTVTTVAEDDKIKAPSDFVLYHNYPNPFNPTTNIKYSLPSNIAGYYHVQMKVYDVLGKEIVTLVNKIQHSGTYEVEFNTKNLANGRRGLSSGIYFYSLTAGNFHNTKKMILLR